MFNQYGPNVRATIAFLKLLNVKVNDASVNETLNSHPDYPTLLCVSDSLSHWEISNAAGKIEKEDIDQLPVPFLAPVNNSDSPLALVLEVNSSSIRYKLSPYRSREVVEPREQFFSKWKGVYLLAEPTAHSGEKDYARNRRKLRVRASLWSGFFALLTVLPLVLLYRSVSGYAAAGAGVGIFIQYGIFLMGVMITGLLLWYEVDKANPALQKVCTSMKKGNCEAVLNSKHARLFSWMSWSEVGFFYFSGALLSLLFAASNLYSVAASLFWVNVLAAPYIIFSLVYQWKVARHWCVLCLGVQLLLFAGLVNGYLNGLWKGTDVPQYGVVLFMAAMYALPVVAWYSLKRSMVSLVEARTTRREYLRLKFNSEIFYTLLTRQKSVPVVPDGMGISLGNPASKNKLLKVCNPYCGPCAKAHPSVESLIEEFKDIHVQIIFACNNGEHDRTAIPAKHLLAIDAEKDHRKMKAALDDWYLANEKDYDSFARKYPVNGAIKVQDDRLNRMKQWCQDTEIQFTPTFFINGKQLPSGYQVEDLKYFLSE